MLTLSNCVNRWLWTSVFCEGPPGTRALGDDVGHLRAAHRHPLAMPTLANYTIIQQLTAVAHANVDRSLCGAHHRSVRTDHAAVLVVTCACMRTKRACKCKCK